MVWSQINWRGPDRPLRLILLTARLINPINSTGYHLMYNYPVADLLHVSFQRHICLYIFGFNFIFFKLIVSV